MNLGREVPDYGEAVTAAPSKPKKTKIVYPTVTIEKKTGNYEYGQEFTATVRFRVREISQGKSFDGQEATHRCTLELLEMDRPKSTKKGLPR
jgi:hypothetical protein